MAVEHAQRSPLDRVGRLLFSRPAHLVLATLALAFAVFAVIDATKERPNDGTVWLLGRPELVVLDVPLRPGTQASLLQPGDRILGIANKLVRGPQEAASLLRKQQIGSTVDYLIERDGQVRSLPVRLTPFRNVDRSYVLNVLLAIVYLLVGFFVYLRSRNEEAARLFFLLCLTFAVFFVTIQNQSSYFWGDIISQNGGALARFLLPALFLHFFLVFPEKKLLLARHPYLAPLLYLLPAMFFIKFTRDQFFGDQGAHIGVTDWLALGLYFTAGLAALLHSYFSYRDPIQKQRVRILTLGTLTGVLPFLLFKVGLTGLTSDQRWGAIGLMPLVAIPVSFGYCIARYSVMQVELLLRRSFVYTLLTGSVLLSYLAVVAVLGFLVLRMSGPTSQLVSVGATLAVAAVLWPVRARVQGSVDRRFLRDREDLAVAVQEFSRQIPRLIQREALLQQVGERLCHLLDLPLLGIYLRGGRGDGASCELAAAVRATAEGAQARTAEAVMPPVLSQDAILRVLEERGEPYWIERPRGGADQPAVTREQLELARRLAQQAELADAGLSLLVPLVAQGRLIGVFALPAKPTGELYRLQEIELVTLVSGQMALQIENARLYEEEVAKQKLEEEMAMARAIQSRLLPSSLPSVPGVELDAVNVSSRQVSGDYYDVITMEGDRLGLVISDVSGKGMPASLLASNLQAALRAQCDTGAGPGTILARVNRQLHASTDPQHFATLFFAVFEPEVRRLRYSSGGHNAPILVRRDGRAELLEEGGLPLGAFDFGDYAEGTVDLAPGDLLFLYTDGLTETRNLDDEEFGTERVERILRQCRGLPLGDLIARVREEVRSFRGREEAEDDITLLALRVADRSAEPGERAEAAAGAPVPAGARDRGRESATLRGARS